MAAKKTSKQQPPVTDTDPPPGARIYYRHRMTGDRAYMVMREGVQHIRYDQPAMERVLKFNVGDWVPDREHVPLTRAAVARVAFVADRGLCAALGLHGESRVDWLNLSDQQRIDWMTYGPPDNNVHRMRLFRACMAALEPLTK